MHQNFVILTKDYIKSTLLAKCEYKVSVLAILNGVLFRVENNIPTIRPRVLTPFSRDKLKSKILGHWPRRKISRAIKYDNKNSLSSEL